MADRNGALISWTTDDVNSVSRFRLTPMRNLQQAQSSMLDHVVELVLLGLRIGVVTMRTVGR